MAVFLQKPGIQASTVDADANGDLPVLAHIHHRFDPVFTADVAGVDPDLGRAALRRRNGKPIIEVDIRHQRKCTFSAYFRKATGSLHVGHRQTDDLASGSLQAPDLCQGSFHIRGFGIQHRLDGYRLPAADGHISHINLSCHLCYL